MKIRSLDCFKKAYKKLPANIQKKIAKNLELLLSNPRHPSLNVKKLVTNYDPDIWYLRVDIFYRLTFQIDKEEEIYILRNVGRHDETLKNP